MGLEPLQLLLTWHLFHNSIKCSLQSSIVLHIVSALNAIRVNIDICCTLWVLKCSFQATLQILIRVSCWALIAKPILCPPCSCLPLIKYVTDLKITPGFIFEVAFFISPHQVGGISDGQHQYRLLNHQFLIVSLCILKARRPLCSPYSAVPFSANILYTVEQIQHLLGCICIEYTMLNVCQPNNDTNIYWKWWRTSELEDIITDLLLSLSALGNLLLTTQCLFRSAALCFLMHELHYAAAKRPTASVLTNAHS